MPYIDRLNFKILLHCYIEDLEGNMVFKLLTDIYDYNIACHLVKPDNIAIRGHYLRLYKRHVHYDLRKYLFWKLYDIKLE